MTALVRAVRTRRALTLDDLATATGLTKSYLSKVERGHSTPSIAAAMKIARALEVDVAQLFSDDPSTGSLTVERATERQSVRQHPIGANMLGKAMSPFILRPGARFDAHAHDGHPGQEFLFVHSGAVELDYDGQVIDLQTGDTAYFDARAPHRLRRHGDIAAEVVVVTYDHPSRRS